MPVGVTGYGHQMNRNEILESPNSVHCHQGWRKFQVSFTLKKTNLRRRWYTELNI